MPRTPPYDPQRHRTMIAAAWSEDAARQAIAAIVADAERAADAAEPWPAHPLDDIDGWLPPAFYGLYSGAAGVIWALDRLARLGATPRGARFVDRMPDVLRHNRALLEPFLPDHAGYLQGDVGVLLVHWRLAPRRDLADQLWQRIEANLAQPSNELMLGVPGTLLAACFLHEETGEARFARAVRDGFASLFAALGAADARGCRLWQQLFLGRSVAFVGLVHGFAGNAAALLRAAAHATPDEQRALHRVIRGTVQALAERDGDLANWPGVDPADGSASAIERSATLVQICHGAPGMIVGLRRLPATAPAGHDGEDTADVAAARATEDLLRAGGELIWQAGPVAKGAGLCHGTAGNGYALLALHQRTGDPLWLERARAFAMQAIQQWREETAHYGRGRYSLWTGDVGLALYLWDCIRGEGEFPTVDTF